MTNLLYGILLCLIIIASGIFVWKNGKVRFFAGIKPETLRNERVLAKRIGISIIAFGTELMILLTVHMFMTAIPPLWIGILAIVHIILILILGMNDQLNP